MPKIESTAGALLSAVSLVKSVTPNSTTLPILGSGLFEYDGSGLVEITATDLTTTITTTIRLTTGMDMEETPPFSYAVPLVRLAQTLKTLSKGEEVVLSFEGAESNPQAVLRIPSQKGVYTFPADPGKDYPDNPAADASITHRLRVNAPIFSKMLDQTSPFISGDPLRPAMMGTLLQAIGGGLKMVSTDGHRLGAVYNKDALIFTEQGRSPNEETGGCIIPKSWARIVASQASSCEDLGLWISEDYLTAAIGEEEHEGYTVVSVRLLDEVYPNYKQVIPDIAACTTIVRVDRDTLRSAVDRTSLYTSSLANQLDFRVGPEQIKIVAQDRERSAEGDEVVNARCIKLEGDGFRIGFNGDYLSEALATMPHDDVVLHLTSKNRAAVIESVPADVGDEEIAGRSSLPDHIVLVMPVMLNKAHG
jgi:DNA polymerase-3 subunit beta